MISERSSDVLIGPVLDSIQWYGSNDQHIMFSGRHSATSTFATLALATHISPWLHCPAELQKYCSCHFHEWIKLWFCYQFPQAGQKLPLAISWNSPTISLLKAGKCLWHQPQHWFQLTFFTICSIHGEQSNASVFALIMPPIIQFWLHGLWYLRRFITILFLPGAWLVRRNFISFQYQNFC